MDSWKIKYWADDNGKSPIEKWLSKLTKEQLHSVLKQFDKLLLIGNRLQLPQSKALGSGLFELREMQFGYRIYYCFQGKKLVILTAAGDKSSQEKDIKVARERLLKT